MNSGRGSTPPGFPRRGNWTDVKLQRAVISYVLNHMDEDELFVCVSGFGRTRTRLERVLKEAKDHILPRASTRTFRRWFNFFMAYGVTPADARQEKYRKLSRKKYQLRSTRGRWTPEDTAVLKGIVDHCPDMYLDEIQETFCVQTRSYSSASYLWKRLYGDVGYSLMVIVNKAKQRDEEERRQYQEFMEEFVESPSQLVYLDETARGRNASRRRRSWFKRGRQPFRDAYFEDYNAKRYTMIAACDINGFRRATLLNVSVGSTTRTKQGGPSIGSGFNCGSRKSYYRCWATFQGLKTDQLLSWTTRVYTSPGRLRH
jgi:hypothetical protein